MSTFAHREIRGVEAMYWSRRDDATGTETENFGDLIGPLVVERLAPATVAVEAPPLVTVGSVLHLAPEGSVVWGSGINGKARQQISPHGPTWDIRSVRGPFTRAMLRSHGMECPEVYGDPALLLPELWPELGENVTRGGGGVVVIPNLNETEPYLGDPRLCTPLQGLEPIVAAILGADLVVGSSLHAIVLADAYGVPARLVAPTAEHPLKYIDYLAGTGRGTTRIARTVDEAIQLGGHRAHNVDLVALREAFPFDLWSGPKPAAATPRSRGVIAELLDLSEFSEEDTEQGAVSALLRGRYLRPAISTNAHREAPTVVRRAITELAAADAALTASTAPEFEEADDRADWPVTDEIDITDVVEVTPATQARLASRSALLRHLPTGATCEAVVINEATGTATLSGLVTAIPRLDSAQLRVGLLSDAKRNPPMVQIAHTQIAEGITRWEASFDLEKYRALGPQGVRLSWHPTGGEGVRSVPLPGAEFSAAEWALGGEEQVPLLSVVVPVHDVESWLPDLLDTVLAQRVPRMEVIAVDDHSSDGSRRVLEEYAARDGRVRVITAAGTGGGNARNVGANAASGRYIIFADSDDIVPDNAYLRLVESLERSGSDLAAGDFLKFSLVDSWRPSAAWGVFDDSIEGLVLEEKASLIRGRAIWNKAFRADFWLSNDIHFPDVPRSNDIVPVMTAYLAANTVDTVADCVYLYRNRPGASSMTARATAATGLLSYLSQELECAAMVEASGRELVHHTYTRLVVESDMWIHLLRFAESGADADPDHVLKAEDLAREILSLLVPSRLVLLDRRKVAALALFSTHEHEHAFTLMREASATAEPPTPNALANAWIAAIRAMTTQFEDAMGTASKALDGEIAPYLWGRLFLETPAQYCTLVDELRALNTTTPEAFTEANRWESLFAMDRAALERWARIRAAGGLEVSIVRSDLWGIQLEGPASGEMKDASLQVYVATAKGKGKRGHSVEIAQGDVGWRWSAKVPTLAVRGSRRKFIHLRTTGKLGAPLSLRLSAGALLKPQVSAALRVSRAVGKLEGLIEVRRRRVLAPRAIRASARGVLNRFGG